MERQPELAVPEKVGDAAVSGILAGILGGILMAAALAALGFADGASVADVLARFSAGEGTTPLAGLFTHLAVSAIYGLIWGYLYRLLSRFVTMPTWLMGLAYGLLLYLIARVSFWPCRHLWPGSRPSSFWSPTAYTGWCWACRCGTVFPENLSAIYRLIDLVYYE